MQRTARRTTGGLALARAATLAITACGTQSQGDNTGSTESSSETGTADLAIVPSVQINIDGQEVPVETSGDPVDPAGDGTAECAEGTSIAIYMLTVTIYVWSRYFI